MTNKTKTARATITKIGNLRYRVIIRSRGIYEQFTEIGTRREIEELVSRLLTYIR